ncbi:MAG: glycosyltransferase family 2 protein [Bacteroidetes bacterium]|nr:glycosyltransferase family 2 protein [Bacteroidota bacterium]
MYLSIIIPLYNEETFICALLDELLLVKFPAFIEKTEIIIVDDQSTDRSYSLVQEYCKEKSNIQLLRQSSNNGKGFAVKTGIKQAAGDIILIQDADMELSPADIPSMLNAMYELKVPFINGSRYLPGVLRPQTAFRRYFANKLFTLLTSLFINVHLTDMACGYKLFRKDLFEKLNLKESRFGFEAELIIKCGRLRKTWIAEVPVRYFPRNEGEGKKLRNSDGLRILKTILKYGLLKMN